MRYAVLGAAGQLGRDLCPRLPGEVHALTRADVDLSRPDTVGRLQDLRPDVVVNCAAYNFVDRAEAEPEQAFRVNAWGVRELARVCAGLNCVLLHFSTDYVFGLEAGRATPYAEADAPGPLSVYGSSKLAGEYFVRALCPRHYVVRTCGLYGVWGSGGKGGNFVETMLRRAEAGQPLRVVNDQVCTPSYTVDVAEAAVTLLDTGRYGLYHVTNTDSCTWFEFAGAAFRLSGMTADLTAIGSAAFGAPARRPPYSVLAGNSWRDAGLPPLRPWPEGLAAYLGERAARGVGG